MPVTLAPDETRPMKEVIGIVPVKEESNVFMSMFKPAPQGNINGIAYGGFVLSQCVKAACETVPKEFFLYTLHAVYLGPTSVEHHVRYEVEQTRDTRTFCTRRINAMQQLKPGQFRKTMTMTCDFHKREDSSMAYSRPSLGKHLPIEDCPPYTEHLQNMLNSGEISEQQVQRLNQFFPLFKKYFHQRVGPPGLSAQILYGLLKDKKTTQEHLAITDKFNCNWIKSKTTLQTHSEQVAASTFFLDGALAFLPLTASHRFFEDAAAVSSLDATLRFFTPDVNVNDFNLVEQQTESAGFGRSFSTGKMYDQNGVLVARMDQSCILRLKASSVKESKLGTSSQCQISTTMPKRKQADDSANELDDVAPVKKSKSAAKEPLKPLDPTLPINTSFPPVLAYEAKAANSIRLATWNVCGLRSCEKKGLKFYLDAEDADIIGLTETKVPEDPNFPSYKSKYPFRYFGVDPQKGYAGVAILSKHKPLNCVKGLPTAQDPASTCGRVLTLEFGSYYVICTYTPNAGDKLKNMDSKNSFNASFEIYLRQLDAKKPVIWLGDINCAQTDKDIRHAKPNWNKSPGFTERECNALAAQLNPPIESGFGKLVDVWRQRHPDTVGQYTYYSYKLKCREKGIGWRLDTFILSERVTNLVTACEIRHNAYGSIWIWPSQSFDVLD